MLWILLSVALVLGSLALLAVLLLRLWRSLKALGRTMAEAERLADGFSALPVPEAPTRPTGARRPR